MRTILNRIIAMSCLVLLMSNCFIGATNTIKAEVTLPLLNVQTTSSEQARHDDDNIYRMTLVSSLAAASYANHVPWQQDVKELECKQDGKTVSVDYTEVLIDNNDERVGTGYFTNNTTYVSVDAFAKFLSIDFNYGKDTKTNTASYTTDGLEIIIPDDGFYVLANERALPTDLIFTADSKILLPIDFLAEIFGCDIHWDEEKGIVTIEETSDGFIASADEVYVEDDLFWLSKIIHAEAGNQGMDGMLGVGNVVLNRVTDPTCPDNIHDVIFDDRYGTQFSVTENGTIHLEPTEEAIIAAKLCLEGYNNVGNSIYFVNPEIGTTLWFRETRTFVARIGNHDFYA